MRGLARKRGLLSQAPLEPDEPVSRHPALRVSIEWKLVKLPPLAELVRLGLPGDAARLDEVGGAFVAPYDHGYGGEKLAQPLIRAGTLAYLAAENRASGAACGRSTGRKCRHGFPPNQLLPSQVTRVTASKESGADARSSAAEDEGILSLFCGRTSAPRCSLLCFQFELLAFHHPRKPLLIDTHHGRSG